MKYLLSLFCIACSIANANERKEPFVINNPEDYQFSKIETLRTWISQDILENSEIDVRVLQRRLSRQSLETSLSRRQLMVPIESNPEDEKNYGFTWPALPPIQIPMLQFVHDKALKRPIKFLEIGSGDDKVLSNLPYAMKGEIWCCEKSRPMLQRLIGGFNAKLNPALKDRCSFRSINSDCLNLLMDYPDLSGYFDVIYVQNVEHLMTIKDHEAFVKVIESLLASDGQAFLASISLVTEYAKKGHPIFSAYLEHKKTQKYPLFLTVSKTYQARVILKEEAGLKEKVELIAGKFSTQRITAETDYKIIKAERPLDIGLDVDNLQMPSHAMHGEIIEVTDLSTENWFTPQIYRDAFKDCIFLTVLDAFFIDNCGKRFDKYDQSSDILFAAAVIKKNSAESLPTNMEEDLMDR